MILFEEDWDRYPQAIVDVSTTNQSFLHLANLLKAMGVKNNKFFLALHDKRLQGVDPFSENLTQEQYAWISAECHVNPWYYFREIACAPSASKRIRFRANRANISLFWSYFNSCQYLLIQPRQTGKSFSTDTLMVYLMSFTDSQRIMLYTKDEKIRVGNVDRIRKLFDRLPFYLNFMTKYDSANMQTITVKQKNASYVTQVAQSSEGAADKIGRGATVETRHGDEIAYCNFASVTLPVMGSAMNAAIEEAKEIGKFFGTIFTTTAGKKDSRDGRYAYEIYSESAEWDDARYYDAKNKEHFERLVRQASNPKEELAKAEGVFAIQGTFSHRQLGYTDKWLKENMIRNKVYGEEAQRDYFNVWTSGTEISPFTAETSEKIAFSVKEPVWRDIGLNGLCVSWYKEMDEIESLMRTHPVVVGLDTSNMINRDNTCLTFVDATNLEVIGSANYNNMNIFTFIKWLCDFLVRYPKVLLVAENKLNAQSIVDYLIEALPTYGINPFKRLFNTIVQEKDSNPAKFANLQAGQTYVSSQYRTSIGYTTTGAGKYSRNNLYQDTLYRAVAMGATKIHDAKLAKEMLGLVLINGRIDHQKGEHDDQVISWLLACWFILNAKNISFYDINHQHRFLSGVAATGKAITPEEAEHRRQQDYVKNEIRNLYEKLQNTSDVFEFKIIERKIRMYETYLDKENQAELSVDNMISNLRDTQKQNAIRTSPDFYNNVLDALR